MMKTIRFCLTLSVFIACILPTHSAAQRVQSQNNFLSKYAILQESDDIDNDILRFSPCIKSIVSKICIIDSKIDHLNPGSSVSTCDHLENVIASCCETLEDGIESCCAATDASITSCCEQLGSRLTIIDSKIDNFNPAAIDSCCDHLENVIGSCCIHLEDVIESCCSFPDGSITSCCEQLGSRLTIIDNKIDNLSPAAIDSCCEQLGSKLTIIDNKIDNLSPAAIDSCCEQLGSKLTVIDNKIDNLSPAAIDSCCEQLGSKLTIIDNKIDNLSPAAVDSCCEQITSRLDAACGATAIHQSDVIAGGADGYVISQPGHYCVAENLQGTSRIITISASDVHLDLNGYELFAASGSGIVIDNTASRAGIVIENGFIVGNNSSNSSGIEWIALSGSTDLTICRVSIRNFTNGSLGIAMLIHNVSNVKLLHCNTLYNGANLDLFVCDNVFIDQCFMNYTMFSDGASINVCTSVHIKDSNFSNNALSGLLLIEAISNSDLLIENSLFNNNNTSNSPSGAGCRIATTLTANLANAKFLHCSFSIDDGSANNVSFQRYGLFADASSSIYLENCQAHNNRESGFLLNNGDRATLLQCQATNNGIHFPLSSTTGYGFHFTTMGSMEVQDCYSAQNFRHGYVLNDANASLFTNCTAQRNAKTNSGSGFSITNSSDIVLDHCTALDNRTNGFALGATVTGLLKECTALGNDSFGFSDVTANTPVQYYANNSCNNAAGNYSTTIKNQNHAPVTSPANARGVDNIDCSSSDLDQIDLIQSCCDTINSKIDHLNPTTANDSCCEIISSKLDATCGATAIHQSDVDMDPVNGYVISQPGHYCVAENLVGGTQAIITIAASDVTLDLNGYELTASTTTSDGIDINSVVSRGIVIRNGFIVGAGEDSDGNGIDIESTSTIALSEDIRINDVSIRNFDIGIAAFGIRNLIVDNCRCEDNNDIGLDIFACQQVRIWRSLFSDNSFAGIGIAGGLSFVPSENIHLEQCSCEQNGGAACFVFNNAHCCTVINCQAQNTDATIAGFLITNTFLPGQNSDIIFKDCHACNFATGFDITGSSSGIIVDSCTAQNNIDGFNFSTTSTIGSLIQKCSALNNSGFGFKDSSTAQNLYENNTACGNGTNYDATITSAPVTSPANARGVMNVDCSNSGLDQVALVQSCCDFLQQCCTQVNSKLDLIMSCIGCIASVG